MIGGSEQMIQNQHVSGWEERAVGGYRRWDLLAGIHSDLGKEDTQNYSEVSCGRGGTGQAAKWAKDGEIKSGSLW